MLLFIDACLRDKQSRTKALCESFLKEYTRLHPEETIETVSLISTDNVGLNEDRLNKRNSLIEAQDWADPIFDAAKQFTRADKILIGAPYWDLSFPAVLKCYVEEICVAGITFCYTPTGNQGLCKGDKMLYISTAGGEISPSNAGFTYWEALCKSMFGIPNCAHAEAEMLDVIGQDVQNILSKAEAEVIKIAQSF